MDAENYLQLPLSQFQEDNILRELNKAVLAFRQQNSPQPPQPVTRRLSPIGESFSSTPPEVDSAKQQSQVCFLNKILTPWNRVLLRTVIFNQLVKFLSFYGTQKFTRARHLILS
jgi:hypothetical protein